MLYTSLAFSFTSRHLRTRMALMLFNYVLLRTEGCSRCRLCTAIVPFWYSMEHCYILIMPFWLSTDEVYSHLRITRPISDWSAHTQVTYMACPRLVRCPAPAAPRTLAPPTPFRPMIVWRFSVSWCLHNNNNNNILWSKWGKNWNA